MSEFTPDAIANALTENDGEYDDGMNAWWSATAKGPVASITITPDDDEGEKRAQHFEAHVFAVEPAPPVATEPVTLPVYVARELAQREPNPDVSVNGWTVVSNAEGEARRDMRWWHLVIRDEAGRHFRASYLVDPDGLGPKPFEDDEPVFTPVERRTRVVQSVEWVTPTPAGSPSDADTPEVGRGR